MAYTDPRTFVTSEVVTATIMNTHLKDQLRWIGGGSGLVANEGRGTTLPASPVDGQLFVYVADSTAGVEWLCKYNSGDSGSYKWHVIGGSPLYALVDTSESTSATSYTALATAGPTITLPLAGDYRIEQACLMSQSGSQNYELGYMSYSLGATVSSNNWAVVGHVSNITNLAGAVAHSRTRIWLAQTASTAITSQYKSKNANSVSFAYRMIQATPIRIG